MLPTYGLPVVPRSRDKWFHMPQGKCIDCGLLALRTLHTMELVEAPLPYREDGKVPVNPERPGFETCGRIPVCYENLRRFEPELGLWDLVSEKRETLAPTLGRSWNIDPPNIDPRLAFEVIHKLFDCRSFITHRPGMSPQEHREILDRQRLYDWQAAREDEDRKWRALQAKEERDWRRDERDWRSDERRRDNTLRRVELGILGTGVAVAIVAVIVAAVVNGGGTTRNYYAAPSPTAMNSQPTP